MCTRPIEGLSLYLYQFLKIYLFVYGCFDCVSRREHQIPWDYSYKRLWAATWVLGLKLRTPGKWPVHLLLSHLPVPLPFLSPLQCLELLCSSGWPWSSCPVLASQAKASTAGSRQWVEGPFSGSMTPLRSCSQIPRVLNDSKPFDLSCWKHPLSHDWRISK